MFKRRKKADDSANLSRFFVADASLERSGGTAFGRSDVEAMAAAMGHMYREVIADTHHDRVNISDELVTCAAATLWLGEVEEGFEHSAGDPGAAFVCGINVGYRLGCAGAALLAIQTRADAIEKEGSGVRYH